MLGLGNTSSIHHYLRAESKLEKVTIPEGLDVGSRDGGAIKIGTFRWRVNIVKILSQIPVLSVDG